MFTLENPFKHLSIPPSPFPQGTTVRNTDSVPSQCGYSAIYRWIAGIKPGPLRLLT